MRFILCLPWHVCTVRTYAHPATGTCTTCAEMPYQPHVLNPTHEVGMPASQHVPLSITPHVVKLPPHLPPGLPPVLTVACWCNGSGTQWCTRLAGSECERRQRSRILASSYLSLFFTAGIVLSHTCAALLESTLYRKPSSWAADREARVRPCLTLCHTA